MQNEFITINYKAKGKTVCYNGKYMKMEYGVRAYF